MTTETTEIKRFDDHLGWVDVDDNRIFVWYGVRCRVIRKTTKVIQSVTVQAEPGEFWIVPERRGSKKRTAKNTTQTFPATWLQDQGWTV